MKKMQQRKDDQLTSLADLQRLHPWSGQRGNGGALASRPARPPAQEYQMEIDGWVGKFTFQLIEYQDDKGSSIS